MKKLRNSKKNSKILTAALVAGALLPHPVVADDKEIAKITGGFNYIYTKPVDGKLYSRAAYDAGENVTNPGSYSVIDNMTERFSEDFSHISFFGSNYNSDKKLTGNDSIVADVIDLAITGKHIETKNDNALGGAILSDKDAEIASILGGFKNNHAKSVNADAKGGAVYNAGRMGSILGNAHIIKSEDKITVAGGGGKDTLAIDVSGTSEIGGNLISVSGGGNKTTINSGEDHYVIGGIGDDSIIITPTTPGGSSDSSIGGGSGNDTIIIVNSTTPGGSGDSSIGGGSGDDTIIITPTTPGGSGDSSIGGGIGDDTITITPTTPGGSGDDSIGGGAGSSIIGGTGDDSIFIHGGGAGSSIIGGTGVDSISVSGDNNTVFASNRLNTGAYRAQQGDDSINGDTDYAFVGNYVESENGDAAGGAIYNDTDAEIATIVGSFKNNYAKSKNGNAYGGAIYNDGKLNIAAGNENITFDGNYVITGKEGSEALGGAIYNAASGILGLYADNGSSITFSGDKTGLPEGASDVDGIYNLGIINIKGDVNLETVNGETGVISILSGNVSSNKYIVQKNINNQGVLTNKGTILVEEIRNDNGTLVLNENSAIQGNISGGTINSDGNNIVNGSIKEGETNPVTLNLNSGILEIHGDLSSAKTVANNGGLRYVNNVTKPANLGSLVLQKDMELQLYADVENGTMNQIKADSVSGNGKIDLKLVMPTKIDTVLTNSEVKLNPIAFEDSPERTALAEAIKHNSQTIATPIFNYTTDYDSDSGLISVNKKQGKDQVNPYIYSSAATAYTTAVIAGKTSEMAMENVNSPENISDESAHETHNNAWFKTMAFNDNVAFKSFDTVESRTFTLAGGYNTDKLCLGKYDGSFGVYAGYVGGKQKFTDNRIEQEGGFIGLTSEITRGNAFFLSTINGGILKNEDENMYGTDKFDTRWFGLGLKGGYNYALRNSWALQLNVYAGYTYVKSEDYTSKLGIKINRDSLNLLEIDPGFKLSTQFGKDWTGFIQGKYIAYINDGGATRANEFALPDMDIRNHFEYGFGIGRSFVNDLSVTAVINRRDGSHPGWNGSIEFDYRF